MAARLLCANWRCNYLQHPNVAEFSGFCCRKCHEWSKNPRRKQHHGRLCQQETPEGPVSRAVADVALRAFPGAGACHGGRDGEPMGHGSHGARDGAALLLPGWASTSRALELFVKKRVKLTS